MIIENGVERTGITVHKEFIVGKAVCVKTRYKETYYGDLCAARLDMGNICEIGKVKPV